LEWGRKEIVWRGAELERYYVDMGRYRLKL